MTAPEHEALVHARQALTHHRRCSIFDMAQQECDCGIGLLLYEIDAVLNAPAVTVTEGWRDGSTAPEDGTEIIVGVTYRYALYKPDGARQMKKPGRWQRMGEFGWENCEKPERWSPLKSTTPQTGSQQ